MANNFTLVFSRSPTTGPACIEYALIPEGMRRTIWLAPGQVVGYLTSPSVNITNVNVFALQVDGAPIMPGPIGLPPGTQWQFPPVGGQYLVGAAVHADVTPQPPQPGYPTAYGHAIYEDGTAYASTQRLFPGGDPCTQAHGDKGAKAAKAAPPQKKR